MEFIFYLISDFIFSIFSSTKKGDKMLKDKKEETQNRNLEKYPDLENVMRNPLNEFSNKHFK